MPVKVNVLAYYAFDFEQLAFIFFFVWIFLKEILIAGDWCRISKV